MLLVHRYQYNASSVMLTNAIRQYYQYNALYSAFIFSGTSFSVHIQDMLSLPIACPKLYQKLDGGNFVVQVSSSQFSWIHYN